MKENIKIKVNPENFRDKTSLLKYIYFAYKQYKLFSRDLFDCLLLFYKTSNEIPSIVEFCQETNNSGFFCLHFGDLKKHISVEDFDFKELKVFTYFSINLADSNFSEKYLNIEEN